MFWFFVLVSLHNMSASNDQPGALCPQPLSITISQEKNNHITNLENINLMVFFFLCADAQCPWGECNGPHYPGSQFLAWYRTSSSCWSTGGDSPMKWWRYWHWGRWPSWNLTANSLLPTMFSWRCVSHLGWGSAGASHSQTLHWYKNIR